MERQAALLRGVAQRPRTTSTSRGHLDRAVASLEAHRAYNDALPDTFPKPAELVGMILTGGGQLAGVEHAVTLDVVERR